MSAKTHSSGERTAKWQWIYGGKDASIPEKAALWPDIGFVASQKESKLSEPQRDVKNMLTVLQAEGYPIFHDTSSSDTSITVLSLYADIGLTFDWSRLSDDDAINLVGIRSIDAFYKAWNEGLEARVSELGWKGTFYIDNNGLVKIEINKGCHSDAYFINDMTTIPEIERSIEHEWIKRGLISGRELFMAAGINVTISMYNLEVFLRRDDEGFYVPNMGASHFFNKNRDGGPVLVCEATRANFERLLVLACTYNEKAFDALKLTLRTLEML